MWKELNKPKYGTLADYLGYIPRIVRADDPRPIAEQVATGYAHGGGYSPFGKGMWKFDPKTKTLRYPGDPPFKPIAELQVRDELFIVYQHAVCAVVQADGRFDVIRMD